MANLPVTQSSLQGTRKTFFITKGGFEGTEISTPGVPPASGRRRIYPKSDGWYGQDSAGNEVKFSVDGHTHSGVYEPANANIQAHIIASAPHSGHVSHSLATAANDFLVASGSGVFVKKTLAETKIVLGLGSAAYTASTDYAVAAKGVTNGDSHDHNGGDGGQVSHAALSNIGTNAHPAIDTFIASKAAASGLASLNASSLVVQDCANPQTPAAHTQAASTITTGTFSGTPAASQYTFPGRIFISAYDAFYGGTVYLYGGAGYSDWIFQLQANNWVIYSNIDADTNMVISNVYAGRVTNLGVTGYLNTNQGFRIGNAAASGKYLRGNGTNFVSDDVEEIKESGGQVLTLGAISDGQWLKRSGTSALGSALPKIVLRFYFDGGSSEVADNVTATQSVPCTGTITKWRIIEASDTPISGSIEFELYKDAYTTYPPTTDITASAPPSVTTATKNESSTLTGWTTTVTEGDTIKAKVVSCTSHKRVVLELWVQPT